MLRDLARLVGSEHVSDGAGAGADLEDATRVAGVAGRAAAVVRPGDAAQVAAVAAWCYDRDVPIVARGGGTGYAGGAVPRSEDAVVLALGRLDRVRSLDAGLWRMEAEAGVRTATVARRARESGLLYPVDPGAAETSQIGGNVATNAGGPHSFKHGVTRAWVTGLEVVLAPGELVRVGGPLRKDVAGYDLVSLLCGSEGTLGVVTSVWLRLVPAPEQRLALAVVLADARAGQAALEAVLASGATPSAIEFLDAGALVAAGATWPGGALPGDAGFLLAVEVEGSAASAVAERDAVAEALRDAGALAVLQPAAPALSRWRDGVSLAVVARRGGKLSEDVAVPLDRLAEIVDGTVAIGARHGLEACSWGHAGDGNVHATFLLEAADAVQRDRAEAAARDLFALAVSLGGTVSGEHGLGLLKDGELARQWAPGAVGAHRAIKRALDPRGLLNPGKKTG